jgi:hypothetical protein
VNLQSTQARRPRFFTTLFAHRRIEVAVVAVVDQRRDGVQVAVLARGHAGQKERWHGRLWRAACPLLALKTAHYYYFGQLLVLFKMSDEESDA